MAATERREQNLECRMRKLLLDAVAENNEKLMDGVIRELIQLSAGQPENMSCKEDLDVLMRKESFCELNDEEKALINRHANPLQRVVKTDGIIFSKLTASYSILGSAFLLQPFPAGGITSLIARGFRLNYSAPSTPSALDARILVKAAWEGEVKVAELCLQAGADVNLISTFGTKVDDKSLTPLVAACLAGREEVVRILLEGGADPECRNTFVMHEYAQYEGTALHAAVLAGTQAVVPSPDTKNVDSANKHERVVMQLIEARANINATLRYRWKPTSSDPAMAEVEILKAALMSKFLSQNLFQRSRFSIEIFNALLKAGAPLTEEICAAISTSLRACIAQADKGRSEELGKGRKAEVWKISGYQAFSDSARVILAEMERALRSRPSAVASPSPDAFFAGGARDAHTGSAATPT